MSLARAIVLAALLGGLVTAPACGSTRGAGGAATLTPAVTSATARPAAGTADPGGKEGY